MSTELVIVEKQDIPTVFEAGGTDYLVQIIRDKVKNLVGDTSTLKGRKEIASLASRVAKSKTYLDGLGKVYVGEMKAVPKAIDAERKRMRDTLDAVKDEVRKPLTEWEEADKARVEKHEDAIGNILETGVLGDAWLDITLNDLSKYLDEISSIQIDDSWEEYESEANKAKEGAILNLDTGIKKRQKHDSEQAELEQMRKEKAEREEKEREEKLRAEGEERARKVAEEKAKAEAKRVEQERQDAIQSQKDAEVRAETAKLAGEAATRNAELRAVQAEQTAKAQAEAAAKAEHDRIEAKQKAEKEAEATRERNTQHKGNVYRAAKEALMSEAKITEAEATRVVRAIGKKLIPNVTISY